MHIRRHGAYFFLFFFEGDLELQKVDPERGSSVAASRALAICDVRRPRAARTMRATRTGDARAHGIYTNL